MAQIKQDEMFIPFGAMLASKHIGVSEGGATHSFKFINEPSTDEHGDIFGYRPFIVISGKNSLDVFVASIQGNIRKISGDGTMTYNSETKVFTVDTGGDWWGTCEVWGDSHLLQYLETV